jgi:uncharacterized coiled-coil protein SlyX
MAKASEVIFELKPVSFRYNKEYDAAERLFFGLIAEEVAEVDPDLVGRNKKGEPEAVRYEQINAMLLNEFLKEHKKVAAQQSEMENQEKEMQTQEQIIAELKSTVAQQQKQIQALTSGLQKVSARLKLTKPVQVVENGY